MAEPSTRLTPVDQAIANAAALLLFDGGWREAEILDLVTDILPAASMHHSVFAPVVDGVMALERLHKRKGLDAATMGARRRECHDALRAALVRFFNWRLMHALERATPASNAGHAA